MQSKEDFLKLFDSFCSFRHKFRLYDSCLKNDEIMFETFCDFLIRRAFEQGDITGKELKEIYKKYE